MRHGKRKSKFRTNAVWLPRFWEYLEDRVMLSAAPQAVGLFAGSSGWQPSFLTALNAQGAGDPKLGYKISSATTQAKILPWVNVNTLSVKFDQNVTLKPDQISLTGSSDSKFPIPDLASATFRYNRATFVATWVFPQTIQANKYLLTIPVSAAASSQGVAIKNTFSYFFDVLPGDVDRNGSTNPRDTLQTNNLWFTHAQKESAYSIFADVDGNGIINAADTAKVRQFQSTSLPASNPTAPSVLSPGPTGSAGASVAPQSSTVFTGHLLGDANGDLRVDLNDLNAVLNHLGVTDSLWTDGNFDGAATIDLNDLNDVLNNLGVSVASLPSFKAGASETVNENSTPQYFAGWATNINSGVSPANQSLSFSVSNDNSALFAAQPAIGPDGSLSFKPAANCSGSSNVTVSLMNNSTTGGVSASAAQTFTITIKGDDPTLQTVLADYDQVRNTVAFQAYYGEMKGATATGDSKAGNAWDQAADLQQVLQTDSNLQSSGIVVQLVTGQIQIDGTAAALWLGTTASDGSVTSKSEQSANQILTQSGLLVSDNINPSSPASSQFIVKHAWVQVSGSFGTVNLDPSWKYAHLQPGIPNIMTNVPYVFTDYTSSTDPSQELAYEYYEDKVSGYLQANVPGKTLADIPHTGSIISTVSQSAPSYPYITVAANPASSSFSSTDKHQAAITIKSASTGKALLTYAFNVPDISLDSLRISYQTSQGLLFLILADVTDVSDKFLQAVQVTSGSQVQIVVDAYDPGTSANREYTFLRTVGQDAVVTLDAKQTSFDYLASLQNTILTEEQGYTVSANTSTSSGLVDSILQYTGMRYWDEFNTQTDVIDGITGAVQANDQVGVGLVTNYIKSGDPILDSKPNALYVKTPHNVLVDLPGITTLPVPLDGSSAFDAGNVPRLELITTNASSLENQVVEEIANAPSMSTVEGLHLATGLQTIAAGTPSVTVKGDLSSYPPAIELPIAADIANGYTVTLPTNPVTQNRFLKGATYYEEKVTTNSYSFGFLINDGSTPAHGGDEDGLPQDAQFPLSTAPTITGEQTGGDPIGLASGNVQHSETDVSLPDYGLPLTFSRQYNSFQATGPSGWIADNGLGVGWTSNYGDYLTVSTQSAVWYTSDGHVYTFKSANGAYTTPNQLSGTLTLVNGIYTYADKDGLIHRFQVIPGNSSIAQLIEVRDRDNNSLNFIYNSAAEVTSVYDAQNPAYKLMFSYDSTNHLSQVIDPTGRTWSYSYTKLSDGKYYLTQVVSPSDASTPELVTAYAYFDKTTDPSLLLLGLLHSITKTDVTDAPSAPQITTFTYYPDRRGFQVTDPDQNTTAVYYELFRNTTEFVNENEDVTTTVYSPKTGLTLKQINPDQTQEVYTWTPVHSLLASYTDALGDTVEYAYDYGLSDTGSSGVGNLVQTVDVATGTMTGYTYESAAEFYQVATVTVTASGISEVTRYAHDGYGNTLNITDAAGDVTTMTYGHRGEVLSRTAPDGNVSQPAGNNTTGFSYNAVGQIWTIVQLGLLTPTGQPASMTYTYDPHYALASVTDATGVVTAYTSDLLGRRTSQTLPDPNGGGPLVTTYKLDAFGNILSMTDPRKLVTQNVFDAKNQLTGTVSSDGTETTYQHDPAGNLAETIDSLGNIILFVFDAMNRKVEVVNSDDTSRFVTYAANGAIALAIDENGYTTANAYDVAGRLIRTTDPLGCVVKNVYDGFNNLLEAVFYPAGSTIAYNATSYQYDLLNRVVEIQGPQGTFSTTAYDADGNVIQQVQYNVSGYNYDSSGVTPGLTNGQGQSVALSTLPVSQQHVTTTKYDVMDRPILTSEPVLAGASSPLTTATTYDAAGRVLTTTDQRGLTTTYGYDAAGRQVLVTAPNPTNTASPGLTTTSTLDADGNTILTTDPAGNLTTDTYDLQSNLLIAATTGTQTAYTTNDADGNVVATTDGDGNRTADTYDGLHRVTAETQAAPGGTVTKVYYPNSELHKLIDANGRLTVYTYDGLGRPASETWYATSLESGPVLNQITWTYNAAGKLASESDNSSITSYTYNTLGRVLTQTNANTGQPVVTYTYAYDGFGNVASRVASVGGVTVQTITSQYDADGRLIQQTAVTPGNFKTQSAATTQQVNYTLNGNGQPTTVTRYQSTGGGPLVLVATRTLAYDNDGRVTSILDQQGTTTLDSYQYTYNNASQITQIVDLRDGKIAYTYDTSGEIATAIYSINAAFNENYTFDAAGNNTADATAGDNRLTSDGTFSYTYDAAGNMVSRTRLLSAAANDYLTLYTWDNRNRVAQVATENNQGAVTQTVTYAYDVQNRRISETVNGVSTFFSYADDDNVALTLNAAGVTAAVVYGPDNLEVSQVDASNIVRWMLNDAQGSVRDVVTLSGTTAQVADHLAYSSFGKVLTETSPATPHLFGYAGQQPDAAVGLNYDQARYYNPQTGRFVSQDPSGLAAGDANLYRYVANDPVDFVDPSGLHIQLPSATDDLIDFDQFETESSDQATIINNDDGNTRSYLSNSFADAGQDPTQNIGQSGVYTPVTYNLVGGINDPITGGPSLFFPPVPVGPVAAAAGVTAVGTLLGAGAEGATGAIVDGEINLAIEGGLGNPFSGKTAAEIDEMFRSKGFGPRGPDPINGMGGYVNPQTGRSYHIDNVNSFGEPPHVDVNRPRDYDGILDKRKYPMGD